MWTFTAGYKRSKTLVLPGSLALTTWGDSSAETSGTSHLVHDTWTVPSEHQHFWCVFKAYCGWSLQRLRAASIDFLEHVTSRLSCFSFDVHAKYCPSACADANCQAEDICVLDGCGGNISSFRCWRICFAPGQLTYKGFCEECVASRSNASCWRAVFTGCQSVWRLYNYGT